MANVYASHPVVFPSVFCTMASSPKERPSPLSTFSSQLVEVPKKDTVLIFQDVAHLFVVSLYGELPSRQSGIVTSERVLVGIHGAYVFRNRHPKVGRHGEWGGREQVDVLRHAGVGGFGGESLSEVMACGEAGLQGEILLSLCGEQRRPYTGVQAEVSAEVEVVFGIERCFLSVQRAVVGGVVEGLFLWLPVFHLLQFGGGDARSEGMVGIFCSELDVVCRGGGIVEVHAGSPVADAGTE